jgi:hypothetical protein
MNKKYIVAALVILAIIATGLFVYLYQTKGSKDLTDEEIKAKYCHITADVRKTDIYCQNPELYRQHIQDNRVIQE